MANDAGGKEREHARLVALGKLTAAVAHKLNNDLTEVTCNLGLALEDLADGVAPEDLEELIKDALAAAEHASRLSRDALSLFRLDVTTAAPVRIAEYLRRAQTLTPEGLVHCSIEIEPTDLQVLTMTDWLDSMLVPVLVNAREACPEGDVALTAGVERFAVPVKPGGAKDSLHDGSYVTIVVQDAGAGLTLDADQDPFEPFVTSKGRGRGLGLSTALQVARAHGGTMGIRNHAGGGAEASLWLPVATS